MKRRKFINKAGVISASTFLPAFLLNSCKSKKGINSNSISTTIGKKLIVIQLSGGNDGLNTIVPYRNDDYYKARPVISIPSNEVLKLDDTLGFNPVLKGLNSLYDEGILSIINNVGYPNPSRSHFRSSDIWHSAISNGNDLRTTGWLGRYLDSNCNGCQDPYHAIEVDQTPSLILRGKDKCGFAVNDSGILRNLQEQKYFDNAEMSDQSIAENSSLSFLYKTRSDTELSASYIHDNLKPRRSSVTYPDTAFAQKLKFIAELISSDIPSKVYYLSLSGFDTHANQLTQQNKVLKTYSDAIKAFVQDLKNNGLFDETLIFTFSEFGRRLQQNASKGTDHGKANNAFLIGNKLKSKGFINGYPNLKNLDDGDLSYTLDFRQIYSTILEKWLDADSNFLLLNKYKMLDII